ncbi:MAG: response regulator, partial [Gammaproteobacteria bacterium]|nr:response regulator [Gammaproteobacteria bacterium]
MINLPALLHKAYKCPGGRIASYLFLSGCLIALPVIYYMSLVLKSQPIPDKTIEVLIIVSLAIFLIIFLLSLLAWILISRRDPAATKDEILSTVNHEIRTQLTAILGFSESLLDSDQSMKERVASINTVIRNTRELLRIIDVDESDVEAQINNKTGLLLKSENTSTTNGIYKGRVLLVEDNDDNQKLFEMYLSKMGADVVLAKTGSDAVDLAAENSFELILMDMLMPVMDGIEATKKIRSAGYDRAIAMITANVIKKDIESSRAAGSDSFITKPVDRNSFVQFVSQYLQPVTSSESRLEPVISGLVN